MREHEIGPNEDASEDFATIREAIAGRETAADPGLIHELIHSKNVTVMQATPSTWRMLIDTNWPGSTRLRALAGGESLPATLAAQVLERTAGVINLYGPTETTIWSSALSVALSEGSAIASICWPISNTRIYIFDAHGKPVDWDFG
jgi:non-ribosomal peptide synthetase component F